MPITSAPPLTGNWTDVAPGLDGGGVPIVPDLTNRKRVHYQDINAIANSVITLEVSHNADGTIKVSGGAGTLGSVPFIGAAGAVSQDNANFFYDSTNHILRGPIYAGGSGTTSTLILRSTTGVGTTGADIIFQTGNNGASERMRLLNNGNFGIGIAAPTVPLHVVGNALITTGVVTPLVAAVSDSTAGLALQTSGGITVIRVDTTNKRVAIGNVPGAPSTTLQVLQSSSGTGQGGSSGLGASSIQFSSGYGCGIDTWDGGTPRWGFLKWNSTTVGTVFEGVTSDTNVRFNGSVGIGMTPTTQLELSLNSAQKPTSSAWTITSDRRTKEQIKPYMAGLDAIRKLEPRTFIYNGKARTEKGVRGVGFIAQDAAKVAPELVRSYRGKLNDPDDDDEPETEIHQYDGHALAFMVVNAVKELDARIVALEKR